MIDATVLRTIEDAEIGAAVADLKRNLREQREQPIEGMSDDVRAQLGALGIPMGAGESVSDVTSTAVVLTLWNRADGLPSQFTFDALEAHLAVRFPADHPTHRGQRVWSTAKLEPVQSPPEGFLCPLHRDSPQRMLIDSLGFAAKACKRPGSLASAYDVEQHVKFKHRDVHLRLERKRNEDREAARDDMLRQQTNALTALLERGVSPATITEATGIKVKREATEEQKQALTRGRATAAAHRAAKAGD